MKMVGHKTEIYRRYAIVDEAMLKEGAAKLQTLHEAHTPTAPVIPLTTATRTKRVSSSTVRVSRAQRARRARAARAKSLQAGEKRMVGWDGIEPPTPGFSVPSPARRIPGKYRTYRVSFLRAEPLERAERGPNPPLMVTIW